MSTQFEDSYSRKYYYLRLSVTEACNFRCTYCLPNGYKPTHKNSEFLSVDELRRVVSAFANRGTSKVRITGGEPSLRKDFIDILAMISEQEGIKKVAMTTNGYSLAKNVHRWRDAGLTDINVSVDSLDPRIFHQITGVSKLYNIMNGIDTAFEVGFSQVKVNVVLLKDLNNGDLPAFLKWIQYKPIQLRFIELMQTGEMHSLFSRHHQSGVSIHNYLVSNGWLMKVKKHSDGPAEVFYNPNYVGEIGLIMPYKKDFCDSCNRLRVSALGQLHMCLFGDFGIDLRDLLQEDRQKNALISRIQDHVSNKKKSHFLDQGYTGVTSNLASIGG
ncbi:GTP 3',8-cyclase MoaA [Candidatus Enterovibrio escicola]|uniref:GTP 3',8-cyclase MoaA n=1 Tax=Candidatus Enterovibrio escicola TaxID=1927127 RepID=UPI000BE3C4A1|nr:GTP 3',8-cyclase MoaA [Candidatus Enterovibrio escacola]